jgi:hypothetical protein
MNRKLVLALAGAAAAVFMAVGLAQAGPTSTPLPALQSIPSSNVAPAHCTFFYHCHRRCWWHRGHRHCRKWCHIC